VEYALPYILAYDLARCVSGCIALWVATQKKRPPLEGWLVGFFLGLLGVLIEACLPTRTKVKPRKRIPTVERYKEPEYDAGESEAADWITGG